jgi:hypothetical protein
MDVYVVCCTAKAKSQARTIKTKKQVRKKYKERTREAIRITHSQESYRLWCVLVCDLRELSDEVALAHVGLLRRRRRKCSVSEIHFETAFSFPPQA